MNIEKSFMDIQNLEVFFNIHKYFFNIHNSFF